MIKDYNKKLIHALHSFFWYEGLLDQDGDEWVEFKTPRCNIPFSRPKYREDDIIHKLIKALKDYDHSEPTYNNYFNSDNAAKIFNDDIWDENNIFHRYSMLWQMLVEMFGEYGTSPRTGWIEKRDECADFLEMIVQYEELSLTND